MRAECKADWVGKFRNVSHITFCQEVVFPFEIFNIGLFASHCLPGVDCVHESAQCVHWTVSKTFDGSVSETEQFCTPSPQNWWMYALYTVQCIRQWSHFTWAPLSCCSLQLCICGNEHLCKCAALQMCPEKEERISCAACEPVLLSCTLPSATIILSHGRSKLSFQKNLKCSAFFSFSKI